MSFVSLISHQHKNASRACERERGNGEFGKHDCKEMKSDAERKRRQKRHVEHFFSIFRIFEYEVHNHGNSIHIMERRAGVVD